MLKLRNAEKLHDHLMSVSYPDSGIYGEYLSVDDVNDLYSPTTEDQVTVMDFFEQITDANVNMNTQGDIIHINALVEHVESHLKTKLGVLEHVERDLPAAIRAVQPISLPEHVADLMYFISLNSPILQMNSELSGKKSLKTGRKVCLDSSKCLL